MKKRTKVEVMKGIKDMLIDVKTATDGKAWTKIHAGNVCSAHGIKPLYFRSAVRAGFIVRNPSKPSMFMWNGVREVTQSMVDHVYMFRRVAPPKARIPNPTTPSPKAPITFNTPRMSDDQLINELRSRGYSGSLTPPAPSPIIL